MYTPQPLGGFDILLVGMLGLVDSYDPCTNV